MLFGYPINLEQLGEYLTANPALEVIHPVEEECGLRTFSHMTPTAIHFRKEDGRPAFIPCGKKHPACPDMAYFFERDRFRVVLRPGRELQFLYR